MSLINFSGFIQVDPFLFIELTLVVFLFYCTAAHLTKIAEMLCCAVSSFQIFLNKTRRTFPISVNI